MKLLSIPVLALVLLLLFPGHGQGALPAHNRDVDESPASAPRLLNYQVRITEEGGVPLEGTVKLAIKIYSASEGGSLLWSETHNGVPLTDGVASVLLGTLVTMPADLFESNSRYLGLTVNDGEEMVPRMRIGAAPYAFEAEKLQGKSAADFEPKGAVLVLAISDGSPPNDGANRVHWNNLTGVPGGLADGVDEGVTRHGELEGLGADDHPQYARKAELEATSGSGPNTGKNLVHWENLVGVPSGFSDGADNTGPGITVHSDLQGLDADDHPQYAMDVDLAAHAADTTLHGNTQSASDLVEGFLSPDRLPSESIDGSKIQNNSLTGEDVQDASVTRDDLADESGLAYLTSPGGDSLEVAPRDLMTVALQCPADGWVLVVGTAQACVDSGNVDLQAEFSVSRISSALHDAASQSFNLDTDANQVSCLPVMSQSVFPVSAGLQTFYLVAKSDSPGLRASRYSLSAVYLPTQY